MSDGIEIVEVPESKLRVFAKALHYAALAAHRGERSVFGTPMDQFLKERATELDELIGTHERQKAGTGHA